MAYVNKLANTVENDSRVQLVSSKIIRNTLAFKNINLIFLFPLRASKKRSFTLNVCVCVLKQNE